MSNKVINCFRKRKKIYFSCLHPPITYDVLILKKKYLHQIQIYVKVLFFFSYCDQMSISRQIRLVLWKNFTIRRRRWVSFLNSLRIFKLSFIFIQPRVIFELIWPLFLFLILMWVRTRNLVFHYDACEYFFLKEKITSQYLSFRLQ